MDERAQVRSGQFYHSVEVEDHEYQANKRGFESEQNVDAKMSNERESVGEFGVIGADGAGYESLRRPLA